MNEIEIIFLKKLYYVIYAGIIATLIQSIIAYDKNLKELAISKYVIVTILSSVVIMMFGLRDSLVGVDTANYKYIYEYIYIPMDKFTYNRDVLWDSFNFTLSRFTNNTTLLFVIVAIGYIALPLLGLNKYFKENILLFLLLFLISPNFFLYGANTIRSGLAASIFLFSFKYYQTKKQWFWIFISSLIHLSMAVPAIFFAISKKIKNIKATIYIWLTMLILAIIGINFLNLLPFDIDRISGYVIGEDNATNKIFNIPINFIVYSIIPVITIVYFIIFKKKYDSLYLQISVTYILSNCLYISAFHSSFTERFAYLSEFLMPFVLLYPFVAFRVIKFKEIYLTLFLFIIFTVKAYKVLII